VDVKALSNDSTFNWPDTRLGPLEPKDRRFPLPGLVGSTKLRNTGKQQSLLTQSNNYETDILTAELAHERQSTILEQFIAVGRQLDSDETSQNTSTANVKSFNHFDCAVHECPQVLVKDFYDMFPGINVASLHTLTVITFCQKAQDVSTEMQAADTFVAKGKVELIESFIDAATDICELLHDTGYWADFVDPTSGRPVFISLI